MSGGLQAAPGAATLEGEDVSHLRYVQLCACAAAQGHITRRLFFFDHEHARHNRRLIAECPGIGLSVTCIACGMLSREAKGGV